MSLHVLGIAATIGFNDIGVRDFGLSIAALSIALHGSDRYCLENKLFDKFDFLKRFI